MNSLNVGEVARSIELYNLSKTLKDAAKRSEIMLEFTREPFMRERKDVGRVVVAFGSYDPLSIAHEALFLKGLEIIRYKAGNDKLDELLIVTATSHFDKNIDWKKNCAIYDRLHAQEGFASCYSNVSLAFFNSPLFVDLGDVLEKKYSKDIEVYFIVGSDVMMKIANRQGYIQRGIDPDAVFEKVFNHRFIVSEREVTVGDDRKIMTLDDLKKEYEILEKKSSQLISADLKADYSRLEIPIQSVSSTIIREKRSNKEDVSRLEAVGISDFVSKRSIYIADNDKYEAFVCARQRFADDNQGKPIASYIKHVMNRLNELDESPSLREQEISDYKRRFYLTRL